MTSDQLAEFNQRPVIVVAGSGRPISLGRFQVEDSAIGLRLCLEFETEEMRCVIRISDARATAIQGTWDGEQYTYSLPSGDAIWSPEHPEPEKIDPNHPIIETFPLPSDPPPPVKPQG